MNDIPYPHNSSAVEDVNSLLYLSFQYNEPGNVTICSTKRNIRKTRIDAKKVTFNSPQTWFGLKVSIKPTFKAKLYWARPITSLKNIYLKTHLTPQSLFLKCSTLLAQFSVMKSIGLNGSQKISAWKWL